jgi:hypothetical protein
MSDSRSIRIKTDKFRLAYNAMRQLAAKANDAGSELKYTFAVAAYEKHFDATTTVLTANETKYSRPTARGKVLTAEGEARQARILAVMLPITLPPDDLLFTKDDLPKKTDEEGDIANRTANALWAAQLGPFYDQKLTGEKKALLEQDITLDALKALEEAATAPLGESDRTPPTVADLGAPLGADPAASA